VEVKSLWNSRIIQCVEALDTEGKGNMFAIYLVTFVGKSNAKIHEYRHPYNKPVQDDWILCPCCRKKINSDTIVENKQIYFREQ
jgi:hypothetical protein